MAKSHEHSPTWWTPTVRATILEDVTLLLYHDLKQILKTILHCISHNRMDPFYGSPSESTVDLLLTW